MIDLPMDSEDPADIEVGCTVWSRTHQDSSGFIGGCVIDVDHDAGTVRVMRYVEARRGPEYADLDIAQLDHTVTTYDTRNAGIVAQQLFAWLGNQSAKGRRGATEWAVLAVKLQSIKDAGTWTAGAEQRYRMHTAALKAQRLATS